VVAERLLYLVVDYIKQQHKLYRLCTIVCIVIC